MLVLQYRDEASFRTFDVVVRSEVTGCIHSIRVSRSSADDYKWLSIRGDVIECSIRSLRFSYSKLRIAKPVCADEKEVKEIVDGWCYGKSSKLSQCLGRIN